MLEYMEKRKPYMLNSILMANNKGLTPIDVAIKYESLKTINILLQYLSKLKDSSYSRLLQDRFNKLLSMNLISFHTYLDSCYFQTIQMKGTKFLNLRSNEEKIVITHKSCLIDESFLKKYTYGVHEEKPVKRKKSKKKDRSKVYEIEDDKENQNQVKKNPFEDDEDAQSSNNEEFKMNESQEKSEILNQDEAFIQDDESKDMAQVPRESNQFSAKSFKQNGSMHSEIRLDNEDENEASSYYEDAEVEHSEEVQVTESEHPLLSKNSPKGNNSNSMADQENQYEAEGESENEGGEDSLNRSIQESNRNGSKSRNDHEEGKAYDPSYNVFTTENRPNTTIIKDKDRENAKSMEIEDLEDYFRKNVSSNQDDIRKIRTEKLIPPNEIKATEKEEARIKEFEDKILKAQEEQMVKKSTKKTFKTISKLDTKTMTKEELQAHREKERIEYYRENIKKRMPVLEITAIEFDWIFGKQGADFINTLTETNSIELFSLKIIKEIITFFWDYYKIRIIIVMLIPFIINFLTFLAYATFLHWDDEDKGHDWNKWRYIAVSLESLTMLFASYFFIFEMLYLYLKRLRYFKSFWNLLSLISIGLNVS